MTTALRTFQSDLVHRINDAWASGARDVLGVLPCGAGKSVVAAHHLEHADAPALFIAHRSELVSGESLALARNGVRHRVIGQPSLRHECSRRHVSEGLYDHVNPNARVVIASVDTLIGLPANDPLRSAVQLVVTDECFPAGTLVDGVPIERLRVGDYVTAFDEVTGEFSKRRVTRTHISRMPYTMIVLEIADHVVIRCTLGHPFWTKRGWTDAWELTEGDEVLLQETGKWAAITRIAEYRTIQPLVRFVYNIEVEELHTYVANGVVVHNCHHLLRTNKWGRALDMFPNAHGLGLTATPIRADGKGLGRHADGVFDVMIEGPTARQIELMGFLTPHVIYAPPSDLDLSAVPVTASGDYSPKPLAEATRRSHIVGDVVQHYKRLADGLLGMTFAVSVESATEIAAAFRAAGVPADVVTGKTPPDLRNAIFRRFRARQILQVVSVDIAGEGFDCPDVEVISLARATESYGLATQQIGRVKRVLPGKERGIVIDHVSNVARHCQARRCEQTGEYYIAVGEREWSLDRRERRTSSKRAEVQVTTCLSCLRTYERVLGPTCPYCSTTREPTGRSAPEQVDGVLAELDPAALAALQGEILRVDGAPTIPFGATPAVRGAVMRMHRERQEAQVRLREAMAEWAGARSQARDAESVARLQREFWLTFGIDTASAQALGRPEAEALLERVRGAQSAQKCEQCGGRFKAPASGTSVRLYGDERQNRYCSMDCYERASRHS